MRLLTFLTDRSALLLDGATRRADVLQRIADAVAPAPDASGRILQAFLEREALGPSDTPDGAAFPHAVTDALSETRVVIAKLSEPITSTEPDWKNVDLVFAVLGPATTKWEHLKLFARLFRFCRTPSFLMELRRTTSAEELLARIQDEDARHV